MAKKADKYPKDCPTKRCFGWGLYHLDPVVIKRGNILPFPVTKQGAEHKPKTTPCPACGASAFPNGRT